MYNFKKGDQFLFRYYSDSKNDKDTLRVESIYEVLSILSDRVRIGVVKNNYAWSPLWEETPGNDYVFPRNDFEAALRGKISNKEILPINKEQNPEYFI